MCVFEYLCICEGMSISVSVQDAASSALMAELRG